MHKLSIGRNPKIKAEVKNEAPPQQFIKCHKTYLVSHSAIAPAFAVFPTESRIAMPTDDSDILWQSEHEAATKATTSIPMISHKYSVKAPLSTNWSIPCEAVSPLDENFCIEWTVSVKCSMTSRLVDRLLELLLQASRRLPVKTLGKSISSVHEGFGNKFCCLSHHEHWFLRLEFDAKLDQERGEKWLSTKQSCSWDVRYSCQRQVSELCCSPCCQDLVARLDHATVQQLLHMLKLKR